MSAKVRRLGLVLAAVGVLVLATATYGFGSIVADRTLSVTTENDDAAYLGYAHEDSIIVQSSSSTSAFSLTNQFNERLDVTVSLDASTQEYLSITGPATLETSAIESYELQCDSVESTEPIDVTVNIEAAGDSTGFTMERTLQGVDIQCGS